MLLLSTSLLILRSSSLFSLIIEFITSCGWDSVLLVGMNISIIPLLVSLCAICTLAVGWSIGLGHHFFLFGKLRLFLCIWEPLILRVHWWRGDKGAPSRHDSSWSPSEDSSSSSFLSELYSVSLGLVALLSLVFRSLRFLTYFLHPPKHVRRRLSWKHFHKVEALWLSLHGDSGVSSFQMVALSPSALTKFH